MTIQEIYNTWYQQWEDDEIRSHGKFQFPEIVYEVRELERIWTENELKIFIEFLKQDDKKRFVANLFSLQKEIPEQLFQPFIDTAIKETDPSFNAEYINPCLRFFGFERVFELLNERFEYGDNQMKIGICKAYYWAQSPLFHVTNSNGYRMIKGYFSKWNGHYYGDDDWGRGIYFEMTEFEVLNCKNITNELIKKREKLLIEEFLNNNNSDVRYQIKLILPDEVSSFSIGNEEIAKIYFKELKNDIVTDNHSYLNLKKSFGIFTNNRIFKLFTK